MLWVQNGILAIDEFLMTFGVVQYPGEQRGQATTRDSTVWPLVYRDMPMGHWGLFILIVSSMYETLFWSAQTVIKYTIDEVA